MARMLIFLDFDGVLRRDGAPLYRLEPDLLSRFESVLRALPHADVVIASSWREAFGLAELRAHFSPDIAARIIGVTPIARERGEHDRHREVSAFLRRARHAGHAWVALDDDAENYPVRENVRILSPTTGFDAAAAAWLMGASGDIRGFKEERSVSASPRE
jgi:hypothetical protein